jgi:ADP-ribose pyrophosphatase
MSDAPESSEIAFEGRFVSVARERWGAFDRPYEVVRSLGAAGVLPVTREGDVLLVRQFRPPIRQRLVEIPAGLLDVEGEDAVTCAARELLEETGHRHESIEFLGGIYTTPGMSTEYVQLFWARVEPEPVVPPEPGVELVRRSLREMVGAARAGRVRDAKTALALLLAETKALAR